MSNFHNSLLVIYFMLDSFLIESSPQNIHLEKTPGLTPSKISRGHVSTCPHFHPRMGTYFVWFYPHSLFAKHLPLAAGERCAHTCLHMPTKSSPAPTAPPSPSHLPSILTWDPEQEEPQELSREPHGQLCPDEP